MASQDPKWTPDVETPPTTFPRTREELVEANRQRRKQEPAAAAQETDSESGAPAAVPLTPRTEPALTHAVNVTEDPSDVRAGPGDAGAADTPTKRPQVAREYNDSWRKAFKWIAALVVLGFILALIF
ncbi:hypothetical protein PVW48_19820 [Dinoroseobacter sp. PD6]|uniref:hypothetical protein n=1 Tax=Dinoroseobacter sp. PD6 TaxID=3028384 RepID=UPI00237A8E64|nr:hypothetical protein [Dinoroseobacter sp. PD6]MDD9719011.1 hypothetical protein [Dinoroseobacter sp. PD6]